MIKNSTEEIVELLLQRALKDKPEMFACTCDACLDDIRARTLNNLKPMYYSTFPGNAYTSVHQHAHQSQADIQLQLNTSILKINSKPSHE